MVLAPHPRWVNNSDDKRESRIFDFLLLLLRFACCFLAFSLCCRASFCSCISCRFDGCQLFAVFDLGLSCWGQGQLLYLGVYTALIINALTHVYTDQVMYAFTRACLSYSHPLRLLLLCCSLLHFPLCASTAENARKTATLAEQKQMWMLQAALA